MPAGKQPAATGCRRRHCLRRRGPAATGRIESVADDADLEDVYETERQLLGVACTRARNRLLVTGVEPARDHSTDAARARQGPRYEVSAAFFRARYFRMYSRM